MDVLDGIEAMLEESGMSKAALARAMGRSRNSIYNMFLGSTDVRVDTLANMADAMGYDLILRGGSGSEIVIDPRNREKQAEGNNR